MSFGSTGPADFGVSPSSGFLPETDPLDHLASAFDAREHLRPVASKVFDVRPFLVGCRRPTSFPN